MLRPLLRRSLAASRRLYHQLPDVENTSDKRYVDRLKLTVRAGNGGAGCVSLWKGTSKGKFRPPDGGDGGAGGDVLIKASPQVKSLAGLPQILCAEHGAHGQNQKRHGRKGRDAILHVPLGTVVTKFDPSMADEDSEGHIIVADLVSTGQEVLVARGGQGSKGNASEPRKKGGGKRNETEYDGATSFMRAGETCHIALELKFMTDAALIGLPNVGKSSLLGAITGKRLAPATGPNRNHTRLGAVRLSPHATFIVVDVPSIPLSTNPSTGGRPLWYLRHAHRAKVLVYVVDASCSGPHEMSLWEQIQFLRAEIQHAGNGLSSKSWMVAINKVDLIQGNGEKQSCTTLFAHKCRRAGAVSVVQTRASGEDESNVSSLKRALTRILMRS